MLGEQLRQFAVERGITRTVGVFDLTVDGQHVFPSPAFIAESRRSSNGLSCCFERGGLQIGHANATTSPLQTTPSSSDPFTLKTLTGLKVEEP